MRDDDAVADRLFEDPRLAQLYDVFDPDRSELDVYCAIVEELGARRVLDVGCGTGTFACMLASRGLAVVGLDPALASLDVARTKPGADAVRWIHSGVEVPLDDVEVDLVTMTGNVAQVFVADDEWATVLGAAHAVIRPGGHLVFESRVPEDRAWQRWTPERTRERRTVPGAGTVERWMEVTDTRPGTVSFRSTFFFQTDGSTLTSDSTLRFRSRDELEDTLGSAGFAVEEVRDAPDRPGREHVLIARRS